MATKTTPLRFPEPTEVRAYASQTRLDPRTSTNALESVLVSLVRHITRRMNAGGHQGRTLVLRVGFGDQTLTSASHTLTVPTAHVASILTTLRTLLDEAMPEIEAKGISLLGVTIGNLQADPGQLELAVAA